ncbi:MAG: hypothetical protein F9K32_13515 [Desulfobulbaceae bacterium]|nr:MAG: hypothetical protein F9K32_13515 [Desulfobulbaceae bacterium]
MSLVSDTLQQIGNAAGKRLDVFSYQEGFDSLWKMVAAPLESSGARTLVIVWDDIPKGNTGAVNTKRYLTPLDWLVAFFLRRGVEACNWRFRILDVGSHLAGNADALALLPLLEKVLEGFSLHRLDRAPEFIDTLLEPEEQSAVWNTAQGHLDLLRQIWAANLTKTSDSDDHHALFNLIGPQLLLKNPSRGREIDVAALRILMESVGLLPQGNRMGAKLLDETARWVDPASHCESPLHLILVDDQWRDGWGEVVCQAVGLPFQQDAMPDQTELRKIGSDNDGKVAVFAAGSAEWLLRKLETDSSDQRFRFRLIGDSQEPAEGEKVQEILLLDLRLFSGKNWEEERSHFARLVAIAKQILASPRVRPWPGFDELIKIENWLAKSQQKNVRIDRRYYYETLTLLPRILALVDLSLPIIIFSSTGQREIVKKLKSYENIITSFEKPRFQGQEWNDLASNVADQFLSAFQRAINITEGRRICATILNAPRKRPEITPPVCSETSSGNLWNIELYTDESDSEVGKDGVPLVCKPLRVGGLLAIFSPDSNPDEFNAELFSLLNEKGIANKDTLRNSSLGLWNEISELSNSPWYIAKVVLAGSIEADYGETADRDLESFHVADNLYLDLTRYCLEITIFHLARQLLPRTAKVSSRINMATRHVPAGNPKYSKMLFERFGIPTVYVGDNASLWEAAEKLDRFGIDISNAISKKKEEIEKKGNPKLIPPRKIRYLGFDTIRPLARDVAGHYRLAPFKPRIKYARSLLLPDSALFLHPSPNKPRAFHLLADTVVGKDQQGNSIKVLTEAGFDNFLDNRLQNLVQGARLAVCGLSAEALAMSGKNAAELCQARDARGAEAILLEPLRNAAEGLSGKDFMFFLTRLNEKPPCETAPVDSDSEVAEQDCIAINNSMEELKVDTVNPVCGLEQPDDTVAPPGRVADPVQGAILRGKIVGIVERGAHVEFECEPIIKGLLGREEMTKKYVEFPDLPFYCSNNDLVEVKVLKRKRTGKLVLGLCRNLTKNIPGKYGVENEA